MCVCVCVLEIGKVAESKQQIRLWFGPVIMMRARNEAALSRTKRLTLRGQISGRNGSGRPSTTDAVSCFASRAKR